MRPPFRKAKPPAPRQKSAIKKPDAERELIRVRKQVKGAITDLEFAIKFAHNEAVSDALETLRKAMK